jgi:hypothetical protein
MKTQISPVAAGVVIAIVVAAALFFMYRNSGSGPTVDTPMDMKKMMGTQQMAPPSRPGGPNAGGPPGPGGAAR